MTAPPVTVRRADASDARAAADVYLRSRKASIPAIPPLVHDDDDVRRHFAGLLALSEVWIAEIRAGECIAVMVLDDDWVDQLYVDPARTGRGIGTELIDLAKDRRPGGLQLWVFESNVRARRFYERHGFVAVEHTDGSGNEEGAPDVRYVWTPAEERAR